MRHRQLFSAACFLLVCCGKDEPLAKNSLPGDTTTSAGDMDNVVTDDMGDVVRDDTAMTPDLSTPNRFAKPSFAGLAQLPIRVEHLAAHPDGGWAILGVPTSGAMVNGTPLTGRFAVGVVDAAGAMVWARPIRPPDPDSELGSVAVDGEGSVYVGLVSFSRSIDFGDGVTETGDVDALAQSGFVVKYDGSGTAQWATGFWANYGLANTFVAARGDPVVAVSLKKKWDPLSYRGPSGIVVGPSFKRSTTRTSFVIPLDPTTGQGQWMKLYSSSSDGTTISDVDVLDDGSILTAGYFDGYAGGTVTDPDGNVLSDAEPGGYVARFRTDSTLDWFTVVGDRLQVATDGSGVAIAGTFAETVDFGGGPLTGPGAFVAAVDPANGTVTGEAVLPGMSGVLGLAVDRANVHALIAPPRAGDIAGELENTPLPTNERFAISFAGAWQVSWIETFPSGDTTRVVPNDIASVPGTIAIGGEFVGEHDFGGGPVTADVLEGFVLTF